MIMCIPSRDARRSAPTQEVDDVARVNEAVTKTVVCAIKSARSDDNTDDWLNPTEVTNNCSLLLITVKMLFSYTCFWLA